MKRLLHKPKSFSFRKNIYTFVLLCLITSFGYSQITVIHTASFESGWDGWTDGGGDASRDGTAARAYDGTYSLLVRDNSGDPSSVTSPSLNISAYNKVDFSFFFYSQSMESGEDFFIEYRDNGSASWTIIRTFLSGTINFSTHTGDFQSGSPGVFYAKTATIHSTSSTFSSTAQFRVRCDASGNDDQIYVDDITIEGTTYNSITDAPGGVTSGLELWLKANEVDGSGVIADNTNLNEWVDSGRGHNARTNTTAQAPLYKNNATDNINFNPVIDFENSSAASNPDMQYIGSHAGSADELKGTGGFYSHDAFIVTIPDQAIDESLIPLDTFCSTDPTGDFFTEDVTGFGYGAYSARVTDEVLTYCIGTTNSGNGYGRADTLPQATDYNQVGIVNFRHNAANNGEELYFNANNVGDTENDAPDFSNVSNTRFWLGRSQKWSGSFGGRIAEVVTYSSRKTDGNLTQERNRIQSYLAIKYGITLGVNGTSQDYVDSAGSVIWDQSVNSGYNYHITGIGRDDDAELNQKQSKTVNTADDITMGLTDIATTNSANANTFSADNSFLVWGNDQGTLAAQPAISVDMSTGIGGLNTVVDFTSVGRTWKVVESGTVGTTKVSIPEIMLSATLTPPGAYLMFVSNTPSFSPTSEYRIMTLNGSDLETTYDFNGTKFVTFGYAPEYTFTRSIYFDGVDDYLDAGDAPNLDLTGPFSISAWIKRDTGTVNVDIISKRNAGSYTDGYSLALDASGRAQMFWKNSSGTTQQIQSTAIIPVNEWHHIAVIYDGTEANIYIDGVVEGAATASLDPPVSNTERFLISAANFTSPTRFFQGNIDEVRVWSVALTEDQLHYIMNQEIEDNTNVAGSYFTSIGVTPTKEDVVSWSNLEGYYPMSTYTFTNAKDESDNGYTATLVQLTTVDYQTAPLPYTSTGTTSDWDTNTTWTNGGMQTIPGATSIVNSIKTVDWNIVSTSHNITMDNSSLPAVKNDNRTLLGLIVNSNELTINGNATSGNGITISHYLELDGVMDLQGESQLIQTDQSDLAISSSGSIERDQQGTANSFTYNYFSSPVSSTGTGANNVAFNIDDVLFDGTIPDDATRSINFGADDDPYHSDGAVSNPIKITSYWLYKFVNQDNEYASWQWIGNDDTTLNVTEGFTMKGISNASSISTDQNYVFIGKPNNVLNGDTQIIHTTFPGTFDTNGNAFTTLTGNPFPSAIDADQFIADNIDSGGTDAITGTLYFWEHWGGGSHVWSEYQGGYATYTTAGGTAATSHPDVDQTGVGTKTPGQYIPVGQGFYVIQEHDDNGSGTTGGLSNPSSGSVVFNNEQRVFQIETGNVESIFTRNANTSQTPSITTDSGKQRIWLGFKSPDGYHRQILAAFLEGATDGIDRGYDGRSGNFLPNDAFFMQDNKYFVIQAFGEFDEEREIPISIFIDSENDNGLQTFMIDKLENIPEDIEIYIKDNISGETHDIKNQEYEVNLASGEHKTRFSLVFKASSLSVDEVNSIEDGINVFMNNPNSTIDIFKTTEVDINKITLFNYLGQTIQVWTSNLSNNELKLPVNKTSTGAYILKIETENKTVSKKLIIE